MKIKRLSDYFRVLPSERVTILGKTGSGKTVLAKRMVQEFNSVIAMDFKHTIRIDGIEITSDVERLEKVGIDFPHIIFRVPYEWESKDLDKLFKWAFLRENTLIYIDEGYSVGSAGSFPKWLKIIAVQGREKNVTLWSLFQRPRNVPTFLVSEAEHLFIFYLNRPEDRDYIDDIAEQRIDWEKINPHTGKKYAFFHVRAGAGASGPYILESE